MKLTLPRACPWRSSRTRAARRPRLQRGLRDPRGLGRPGKPCDQSNALIREQSGLIILRSIALWRRGKILKLDNKLFENLRQRVGLEHVVAVRFDPCGRRHDAPSQFPNQRLRCEHREWQRARRFAAGRKCACNVAPRSRQRLFGNGRSVRPIYSDIRWPRFAGNLRQRALDLVPRLQR